MALTITPLAERFGAPIVPGSYRREFVTITFDASYPTGGYALTASNFGLSSIVAVDANPSSAAHPVVWNQTTNKLQVFTSQGTEVANTTDIHTVTCLCEVIGL